MRSNYGLIETRPVAADETMILREYIGSSPLWQMVWFIWVQEASQFAGLTSGRRSEISAVTPVSRSWCGGLV
jgi:hypothetical protein